MSPRQSVSDLSTSLSTFIPGGLTIYQALNRAQERFYGEGCFDSMAKILQFASGAPEGTITLPRRIGSLLGIAFSGAPRALYSKFHQFNEAGVGYVTPDQYQMDGVIDMGSYPTQVDIETEGALRLQILNAGDAAKTVRLFGSGTVNGVENSRLFDTSGNDGVNLTTVSPTADTAEAFSVITDILMPTMVGWSRLSVIGSTVTQIAEFEPGETRPSYRRYKVGVTDQAITCFARAAYHPASVSTDIVEPACTPAFQAAFQAIQKEMTNQWEEAEGLWSKAKTLLNNQLRAYRGGIKGRVSFLANQSANTRSVY